MCIVGDFKKGNKLTKIGLSQLFTAYLNCNHISNLYW